MLAATRMLIVLGVVLLGISILAEPLGLGSSPGFGARQITGTVVAVLILVVAFVMRSRHAGKGGQGSLDSSP